LKEHADHAADLLRQQQLQPEVSYRSSTFGLGEVGGEIRDAGYEMRDEPVSLRDGLV